jgi:hypothetical protein
MVLEQHRDVIVMEPKSIKYVGYEEALYDYAEDGVRASIEEDLNRTIETPFSRGPTWLKISSGAFNELSAKDRLPIYGFARHLQRRNLEMFRFIQTENERVKANGFDLDLSEEEREMHRWLGASADRAHILFREGALDTSLPADASGIGVMACHSPIALRSSTNPTLVLPDPGGESVFGSFFNSLRTWWLTLDRHYGVFIFAGGLPGFTKGVLPHGEARRINLLYLVQHLNSSSVRYLIADDEHLKEDLGCAGYRFDRRTDRGCRYRKVAQRP